MFLINWWILPHLMIISRYFLYIAVLANYRLLQLNTNLTIMGIFGVGLGGGVACPKTSVDRIKNLTFPSGGCSIKRSSWLVSLLILATYFYTGANRPRQNFSTFIWFSPRHYKESDYEITLQWNYSRHLYSLYPLRQLYSLSRGLRSTQGKNVLNSVKSSSLRYQI